MLNNMHTHIVYIKVWFNSIRSRSGLGISKISLAKRRGWDWIGLEVRSKAEG